MPRFAANLSMLFRELPVLERPAAARDAGFAGVEILFPYDEPGHLIRQALDRAGLPLILINTPPPNWTGGDRGFAAIPGGEERFRHDFRRALRYAQVLGARHIHVMAGVAGGLEARDTFIRNLAWAAATAPEQPLTIEPINTHDMPGYFLDDFDLAAEVLDTVGAPNLALQFDAYHAHRITGDVMGTWAAHGHRAAHVQVAGYPGRHEPAGGEIDYPAFFARLDSDGYAGFVSGEYAPEGRTGDGIGWIT
ncbi:hydroxypyruvate isomerase [Roseovarius pacificus]|uniref:Hydroxypyruvate isomerase n=1 Tax=Roseovarius pacificus TaxID=337701 RepID=A0A1M7BIF0_9RHOB|nr:TIM barrel protein [Roseovarius pacificus]GGO55145.1 hydroxypyruvate isomerase [Roseovarius pacificus]SHL54693.1 hydroxypyruvate isomerase [Roseovarius pacificus]